MLRKRCNAGLAGVSQASWKRLQVVRKRLQVLWAAVVGPAEAGSLWVRRCAGAVAVVPVMPTRSGQASRATPQYLTKMSSNRSRLGGIVRCLCCGLAAQIARHVPLAQNGAALLCELRHCVWNDLLKQDLGCAPSVQCERRARCVSQAFAELHSRSRNLKPGLATINTRADLPHVTCLPLSTNESVASRHCVASMQPVDIARGRAGAPFSDTPRRHTQRMQSARRNSACVWC